VIFPLVFLLTFVPPPASSRSFSPRFCQAQLAGGAYPDDLYRIRGSVLSFGASILYLMQERALKSKSSSGMFSRLPALQVIDDIGYRSLMLGFPFMTLG